MIPLSNQLLNVCVFSKNDPGTKELSPPSRPLADKENAVSRIGSGVRKQAYGQMQDRSSRFPAYTADVFACLIDKEPFPH